MNKETDIETINIEKYAEALNNLIGVDSAYYRGDKDVDAIVEVIVAAKKFEEKIKELTEENQKLKQEKYRLNKALNQSEDYRLIERANTVRKMHKRLTSDEFYLQTDEYDGIQYVDFCAWVDQIAKEILEGNI